MAQSIDQSFPSLHKIKTKPGKGIDSLEEKEKTSCADVAGCVTPTSAEHRIKPLMECPKPPNKPPPPKRKKAEKIPNKYQLVPRDLSVVFADLPPKKRLRAGSHL